LNNDTSRSGIDIEEDRIHEEIGFLYCFAKAGKIHNIPSSGGLTRRQPHVRGLLDVSALYSINCKFGECQPPETARIARLTVRCA